jgi:hypothetical protein
VRPRLESGASVRPLNFTVMRLAKSPRTLAAISFVWPKPLDMGEHAHERNGAEREAVTKTSRLRVAVS